MITTDDVVAAARSYIGTPWVHRGRDREGMDCAGLLIAVARDLGLNYPGKLFYERLPDVAFARALLEEFTEPEQEVKPGCIVLLTMARRPQHMGFIGDYKQEQSLIHSYMTVNRVCEHRIDEKWRRRIVYARRIKGVA
jgi:hypothetical protein